MIKNISVIGAGTMGHGIAGAFAMYNYKVSIYDRNRKNHENVIEEIKIELEFMAEENYIEKDKIYPTLSNIKIFSNLEEAIKNADYVIEAIPEVLELKQELFNKLDKICPQHTIITSNTSSLSLSKLMEHISAERKKRIMICHWYNPAHLMPIIELSYFGNMPEEIFSDVYSLYLNIEKQPITVKKDISGMIANRMLHALAREVFYLIEIDAVSPEDIEKTLKYGPGFRGATTGILESADLGGLDIWCTVEDNLFKELNGSKKASDLLKQKVNNGKLGLKTDEGFFKYPKDTKEKIKKDFFRRLIIQLKASKNY
ncbi:3-hydroxyacyl-CoA dehydrogenase family protein [Fusobacterium sp.]|uniref:3-hydroxyacyl-CoA dehydrogenase family protein n=1 Tax=Fusobacterium sp. TaxID=68766 RepID=UPI0028FDF769|nr:3-hydroxyacyl-CoA dehydrogenase NAD-binding domain-containing protein [Fusobacterium sp.]MDU1910096.1 3-hydroxyacyl-CoA dehydrogenase NAD-binding domain-containing protein [Fusobacterium sp.]